ELLAQAETSLLAGEEAVRRRLDHESVDALGADLPPDHVVAVDEQYLDVWRKRLEAPSRRETGDPSADDDDPHAARASTSHESARSRTSCASTAMKAGSSFNAGGRSSRIPRP